MSWSKIGYANSRQSTDIYKKYEPSKANQNNSPSKPIRIKFLERSKSFQKIKHSIDGRDSSKHTSVNHIDLSYQRPSTPLSKSSASFLFIPQGPLNVIGTGVGRRMKRIKGKLDLYLKDLKQQMRILKSELWIQKEEFSQFRSQMEGNVQKLIDNFNKKIISQKTQLINALNRVNQLTSENKELKSRIEGLTRCAGDITPYAEKRICSSSIIECTVQSPIENWKVNKSFTENISGYRTKGFAEFEDTINQLKQIFVDPFEI